MRKYLQLTCTALTFVLLSSGFAQKKSSKIMGKLKLVIPKIRLQDSSIEDAVAYIKKFSRNLDPDQAGINIILFVDKKKSKDIKINIDADNMPVAEAIKYICDQAKLPYVVENHAVVIGHSPRMVRMETKFYLAQAKLIEAVDNQYKGDFQKFLELLGVKFSPGAKVVLVRAKSRLVITNTAAEHVKIAKMIKQL